LGRATGWINGWKSFKFATKCPFLVSKLTLNFFVSKDGIIDELCEDWPHVGGYRFPDIPKIIYENDCDIISTLSTFEHLSLLSQTPINANSPLNLRMVCNDNFFI